MIPRAKASAGYLNFIVIPPFSYLTVCKKLYASLIPFTAAVEDLVAPETASI